MILAGNENVTKKKLLGGLFTAAHKFTGCVNEVPTSHGLFAEAENNLAPPAF